ncbi:hypothetical protein MKW92_014457 [Papaver armeniacum]|nr:hypothetical protein MKW92_014457 [Papaver armeniacum]
MICYQNLTKARDAFYSCIEKGSNKKPTETPPSVFSIQLNTKNLGLNMFKLQTYLGNSKAWVKHFDRQYREKKKVQRLLDNDDSRRGPMSLPKPITSKP